MTFPDGIVNLVYGSVFVLGILVSSVDLIRRLQKLRKGSTLWFSVISNRVLQSLLVVLLSALLLTCFTVMVVSILSSTSLPSLWPLGFLFSLAFLPRVLNLQFLTVDDGSIEINHKRFQPRNVYKNSGEMTVSLRTASDSALIVRIPNRFLQTEKAKNLLVKSGIREK